MASGSPERRRAYAAEWRAQNKDKIAVHVRKSALKRKYGLTLEDYDAMVVAQDGRCAICPATEPGGPPDRRGFWHIDHDHMTGRVRGLLCLNCNTSLGRFGDSIEILQRAIDYLEKHSSPSPPYQ